jgi:hypothetical protein
MHTILQRPDMNLTISFHIDYVLKLSWDILSSAKYSIKINFMFVSDRGMEEK